MKPHGSIKVAIVDDDPTARDGVAWLLDSSEDIECVGKFGCCDEAYEEIADVTPDVVLMDINLPKQSGIECVEALKANYPELKILMLTNYSDDERIFESLRAGAVGYLVKNTGVEKLSQAIREAYEGGAPMSVEVARKVLAYFHNQKQNERLTAALSERESEVLNELTQGLSDKMIAERLFISIPTVRFHLKNIYAKLHVNSRSEAVIKAMKDRAH